MNRRGFLGSVLGLVTTTPFLAQLLLTTKPQRVVLPYKMGLILPDDLIIQMPGVAELDRVGTTLKFIAEELRPVQSVSGKGIALYDMDNVLIAKGYFSQTIHMVNGDTLKTWYTLSLDDHPDIGGLTTEQIIKLHSDKFNNNLHNNPIYKSLERKLA